MRNKVTGLVSALIALAYGGIAEAAPVTKDQVKAAARTWAARGRAMGQRIGSQVKSAEEIKVDGDGSFYTVQLEGGGTLIMSANTEYTPVIAFSDASSMDLSEKSPLRKLLERDIHARAEIAKLNAARRMAQTTASGATGGAASDETTETRQWAALLGGSVDSGVPSSQTTANGAGGLSPKTGAGQVSSAPIIQASIDDDIRVAPLLTTKWDQTLAKSTEGSGYSVCFNYYTWDCFDYDNPSAWPCGCSATAMSQILRYFKYPAEGKVKKYKCDYTDKGGRTVPIELETKAGPYEWDKMVDWPKEKGATKEEREAIGHLTYDCSVALNSSYTREETGASPDLLGRAFRDHFGYVDGWMFWDGSSFHTGKGGLHELEAREKVIYANLDAGRPLQFAIYGYAKIGGVVQEDNRYWGGHAVVGDGYGFLAINGETNAYVHVNLGWSGTDDAWYNLPEIDTAQAGAAASDANGYDFMFLGGAAFNLATNECEKGELLTGRIVDDEGIPFSNAVVTAYRIQEVEGVETEIEAKTFVTGANGIYHFALEGSNTYVVRATNSTGKLMAEVKDRIILGNTKGNSFYVVSGVDAVGNSWGNDMVLTAPSVRIDGLADEELGYKEFPSLDSAFAYVQQKEMKDVELKIIEESVLRRPFAPTFNFTIASTNEDATLTPIVVRPGAFLTLGDGVTATLTNVVFSRQADEVLVDAQTNSTLRIGGLADVGRIRLAEADNLELVDAIREPIMVDAPFAKEEGAAFGSIFNLELAKLDEIAKSAYYLLNVYDDELGGEGKWDGHSLSLTWKFGAQVPEKAAVARFEASQDDYTNYRSLAVLFKYHTDGTVAVLKNAALVNYFDSVDTEFVIYGANAGLVITPSAESGFNVVDGGSLTFSNITFKTRSSGTSFITVDGGQFTLAQGATLDGLDGAGDFCPGAITILDGTMTMKPDSSILNCTTDSPKLPAAGAIWLNGMGCVLNLEGGKITRCHSEVYGGGVYANYGAEINLSGNVTVYGNTSGAGLDAGCYDDIYLGYGGCNINLLGNLTGVGGESRVGISYLDVYPGDVFAAVAPAVRGEVTEHTLGCFVYEGLYDNQDLVAAVSANGANLTWEETVYAPATERTEYHVAQIVRDGGSVTNFYEYIEDAFKDIDQDGLKVELLKTEAASVAMFDSITVDHAVTLTCAPELAYLPPDPEDAKTDVEALIHRMANCGFEIGEGGSLVLDGISISGIDLSNPSFNTEPLFLVNGGDLSLTNGAAIVYVWGFGNRAANAVAVYGGGRFTMVDGTSITGGRNAYLDESDLTSVGSAVLIDDGAAYLYGGTITRNSAYRAGGVFVGNHGKVYLSGNMKVSGNQLIRYVEELDSYTILGSSDMVVEENGQLFLDGEFGPRASIGIAQAVGDNLDTNLIGRVSEEFFVREGIGIAEAAQRLGVSALRFFRDEDPSVLGRLMTNATDAVLVWSSAVVNGVYVGRDGVKYYGVDAPQQLVKPPTVVDGLVYNAAAQTGITGEDSGYLLTGHIATNAGTYTAVATLGSGCVWSDNTFEPKTYTWSIAPASLTVETVKWQSKKLGTEDPVLGFTVTGIISPDVEANVITGKLARVAGETVGSYEVNIGTLGVAGGNYVIEKFTGAQFVIIESELIPFLPNPARRDDVTNALLQVTFADPNVASEISGSTDSVTLYNEFKAWANTVEGGEEAVLASEYAWESFLLGLTKLIEGNELPELPESATSDDVEKALDGSPLADKDRVKEGILASEDPVAAYNDFKAWAGTVEGGEAAVLASEHAWESYEFGVTELFENTPTVKIVDSVILASSVATFEVTVKVWDGDIERDVSPESVAKLFEASTDLFDWTLKVEVVPTGKPGQFDVMPAGNPPQAFIRLKY